MGEKLFRVHEQKEMVIKTQLTFVTIADLAPFCGTRYQELMCGDQRDSILYHFTLEKLVKDSNFY